MANVVSASAQPGGQFWPFPATPGIPCLRPGVELRIRRLGVRIPPSALHKSRSEVCIALGTGRIAGKRHQSVTNLLSGVHGDERDHRTLVLTRQHVGIGVESDLYVGMAEEPRDDVNLVYVP